MKKNFLFALSFQAITFFCSSQVLFNSSFNTFTLQTYTTSGSSTQYTDVPSGFSLVGDGYNADPGSSASPNAPFHIPSYSTKPWAVVYNAIENDTFMVSTSWLDTVLTVDRWAITPLVSGIGANAVLTWRAKSPDAYFPDGYEVYATNSTSAMTGQDLAATTRLFSIADGNTAGAGERNTWTRRSVNLSANNLGPNLRFAFRNNSKSMYQLWIDDIAVINLPHATDAAMQEIVTSKYVLVGSNNSVQVKVINTGATDITSLVLGYSINNGTPDYETLTPSSALSYGQSGTLSFALPYSLSSRGLYTIKAWVEQVNGAADQDTSNNVATFDVTAMTSAPSKTVMIEQFLSANDGNSPDGQQQTTALQSLPAIVVNIHTGDALYEPGIASLVTDYKRQNATAMLDRTYYSGDGVALNRPDYGPWINVEHYKLGPAALSISSKSWTPATRELIFTVQADFKGEVKGDFRINAYLTENQVCGPYADTTINGYNQLNNYYSVPWANTYEQGYYSSAAGTYVMNAMQYKHQNTLIHTFDGAYGLSGVITATGGTQDQSFQKTFTVTIPQPPANVHKFNPDNIYIVGFLAEYNADKTRRNILNAVQEKLNNSPEFVGIPELKQAGGVSVYPNPSVNGVFFLSAPASPFELKVYDLFGKCLRSESRQGPGSIDLSGFADGVYLLSLRSGNEVVTQKLMVQKN